jgi:drug/metabolite transporter (DMT)-like permease
MGVLLGLLTALAWGSSDFLARFASRRIGSLRTTLYMQLTGFLLLTISLRWIGSWGHLFDGSGWQPWAWGALAGIVNGISTLSLYRSFEVGKMAVVAPLSASYPALTVILSLFSGEHLTIARAAGIVWILAGVVLVARGETQDVAAELQPSPSESVSRLNPLQTGVTTQTSPNRAKSGMGWALIAAGGFGVLFWLLGTRIVPAVGFASTVWMIRLVSSLLTVFVILLLKRPLALPRRRDAQGSVSAWLLGMGLLDTGAFVLNNRGMQLEQISVVSVLASLYGAVTVILAALFLREHLSRSQWFGIVAIFAGIALISR